jgi:predicted TPR repeat methyltransferase
MEPQGGLLGQAEKDPEGIRALYDDWASEYDADIGSWGYEAPRVCAEYLKGLADGGAAVLDAGCGTGLSGQALADAGFRDVTGIDFSARSLEIARARGVYRSLEKVDLTRLPTPFPDGRFAALVCVGVLSYVPDMEAVCREFCRLVAPGSPLVITQRSDLFDSRHTRQAFDALVADGTWEELEVTGDRDYLPENPEFAEIGVRYCVFRRL